MGFGHPARAHLVQDDRMPDLATCQAASEPARPAPTICMGSEVALVAIMATEVAAFPGAVECGAGRIADTTTPAASGRYPLVNLKKISRYRCRCNARNVRAIEADIGQFAIASWDNSLTLR